MSQRADTTYKTKIDAFDKCSMYGYLKYFFMGRGVEPEGSKSPELVIGSCIHAGVDVLWRGGGIDVAVAVAHGEYDYALAKGLLDGVDPRWVNLIKMEQRDVIEGVLTLWSLVRLPKLLQEYDFVQAEYKMVVSLAPDVNLYARPDAILQSKFDGRFLNWSLKTEKSHGYMKHPGALIDTGGLTEAVSAAMTVGGGDLRNISGTMMEYLVVGSLDKDEPIIWHPCIRGWRRPSEAGGFEYAWKWKYDNPDYDPAKGKNSKSNPETRSLSGKDGWERFEARKYPGGIRKWVEDLVSRKFVPFGVDPVAELILAPEPYTRTTGVVERFVREQIAQVRRQREGREAINEGRATVEEKFPMERTACLRYGDKYRCEMWNICHEGAGVDPFNQGYQPRKSASQREKEKDAYLAEKEPSNDGVQVSDEGE